MKRNVLLSTLIFVLLVLVVFGNFILAAPRDDIKSVNIHRFDKTDGGETDMDIYRSGDKFYLSFSSSDAGFEDELYEITKDEFFRSTEMIDTHKLSKMPGVSSSVAKYTYTTITVKTVFEKEYVINDALEPDPFGFIKKLLDAKREQRDTTQDIEVWKCFRSFGCDDADLTIYSGEDKRYSVPVYGYGNAFIDYYKTEEKTFDFDFPDIVNKLLSEVDKDETSTHDPVIGIKGILYYCKCLSFKEDELSREQIQDNLDKHFSQTNFMGMKAYTRTIITGEHVAVILLVPETGYCKVYVSDLPDHFTAWLYGKCITQILVNGKATYISKRLVILIVSLIVITIAYVIVLRKNGNKKDPAGIT